MTIEVGNIGPLAVILPPKDTALQKSSIAEPPSCNSRASGASDNPVVLESDVSWEKGTFIDIYV